MSEKSKQSASSYKTEEQLKQDAREQAELEALLASKRKPRSTTEKKVENYWYHYKWATIGGVVGLALIAFFIKDMFFRTDPDFTIIICTERYITSEMTDAIEERITPLATDVNGDGKVVVAFDNLSPFSAPADVEEEEAAELTPEELAELTEEELADYYAQRFGGGTGDYAMVMKLMTLIAASDDPIFLVDDASYNYLVRNTDEPYEMFIRLDELIAAADDDSLAVEDTVLAEVENAQYLDGMYLCFKNGREDGKRGDYRQACLEFLQAIAA